MKTIYVVPVESKEGYFLAIDRDLGNRRVAIGKSIGSFVKYLHAVKRTYPEYDISPISFHTENDLSDPYIKIEEAWSKSPSELYLDVDCITSKDEPGFNKAWVKVMKLHPKKKVKLSVKDIKIAEQMKKANKTTEEKKAETLVEKKAQQQKQKNAPKAEALNSASPLKQEEMETQKETVQETSKRRSRLVQGMATSSNVITDVIMVTSYAMADIFNAIAEGTAYSNAKFQKVVLKDERTTREIALERININELRVVKSIATIKGIAIDYPKAKLNELKARRDTNDAVNISVQ